jgi:predicted transposase YdaD
MKTDELFHEYFQLVPHALFELLQIKPGCPYRFTSPVIKASQRRLDGLLEPTKPGHPRYILEIQGYLDNSVYWRGVQELGLYFGQQPILNGTDWRLIMLFLDKAYDPGPETLGPLYHGSSAWLIRGVLPDLLRQTTGQHPLLNVLHPLVVPDEATAKREAPGWVNALHHEAELEPSAQVKLTDILVQFIGQRFTNLEMKEIEAMLHLTPFEETRAGRDLIERGELRNARKFVLEVLITRFGDISPLITVVIDQIEDLDVLRTLHREAVTADSLASFEYTLAADSIRQPAE